ncbi:MAG TPA: cytochrome c peroxidase, partial [Planctomycetota bacterium]|nr:cytochrome c peroxidase [Planctomycetota bacterium]
TLAFGIEVQVTHRRAPPVINAAYATRLFVDGRADDVFRDPVSGAIVLASGGALESQIAEPPVDQVEMGHIGRTWTDIANTLPQLRPLDLATTVPRDLTRFIGGRTYDALFTQVFGTPGVTPVRIIFAIASYERSLISDRSPYDLYLAGQGQLSPLALAGLQRFQTLCASCHTDLDPSVLATGPGIDDFRNTGVRPVAEDMGREIVTGDWADRGKFRVPGLRNVALRSSLFHNGRRQTLAEVIDFYSHGGDFADNRDPLVTALNGQILPSDRLALEALLQALTDPRVAAELPPFDRPRLWLEGALVPTPFGTGTPGTLPTPPRIAAVGPAYLGNDAFGVGVDHLAPWLVTGMLVDRLGSSTPIQLFGHNLFVAGSSNTQLFSLGVSQPAPAGDGYANWVFHVPPSNIIAGTYWFQWIALDPNGPSGFASSNGMRIVVH